MVLDFIRQWPMHRFGKYAMAIDRIRNAIADRDGHENGDMSFYISKVENLFLESDLMALDEYGVPLQLSKKLKQQLASNGNLDRTLQKLRQLDIKKLQVGEFEKELLYGAQQYV